MPLLSCVVVVVMGAAPLVLLMNVSGCLLLLLSAASALKLLLLPVAQGFFNVFIGRRAKLVCWIRKVMTGRWLGIQ